MGALTRTPCLMLGTLWGGIHRLVGCKPLDRLVTSPSMRIGVFYEMRSKSSILGLVELNVSHRYTSYDRNSPRLDHGKLNMVLPFWESSIFGEHVRRVQQLFTSFSQYFRPGITKEWGCFFFPFFQLSKDPVLLLVLSGVKLIIGGCHCCHCSSGIPEVSKRKLWSWYIWDGLKKIQCIGKWWKGVHVYEEGYGYITRIVVWGRLEDTQCF